MEPQLVEAVIADVEGRPGALPLALDRAARDMGRPRTTHDDPAGIPKCGRGRIRDRSDGRWLLRLAVARRTARARGGCLLHLAGEEGGVDVRRRVPLAILGVDDDPIRASRSTRSSRAGS